MDDSRFDDLTRALAVRRTRRGVLGSLAGLVAGAVGLGASGAVAACPAGQVAASGGRCVCKSTGRPPGPSRCPAGAGQTLCNGVAVDLSSDTNNCSACGRVCGGANATGTICRAGQCFVTACAAGFADCNGTGFDGCETTLGTNQNCSGCGDACTGFETCGGGGTPNVCGCTKRTCPPGQCGTIDDGCGGTVACPACPPCQACGGDGVCHPIVNDHRCGGCCDAAGTCQFGTSFDACGLNGEACEICPIEGTCEGNHCCQIGLGEFATCSATLPCCSDDFPCRTEGPYAGTCCVQTGDFRCRHDPDCCSEVCCNQACCATGQVCHATTGACCTPTTCQPGQCGQVADGCGRMLNCGPCCTPACAGKQCGDDLCGSTCGSCTGSQICNPAGQCVNPCTPSCAGKACGESDDCGGICQTGTCPDCQTCNAGACVFASAGTPCGLPASCTGGIQHAQDTCNAGGACLAGANTNCGVYACGGTTCLTECHTDDQCSETAHCESPVCLAPLPNGGSCNDNRDCASGICNLLNAMCCSQLCPDGVACRGFNFTCGN